jgi:hypothetical protein
MKSISSTLVAWWWSLFLPHRCRNNRFVGGNNFTGFVPPSLLNNPGLTFTYTANGGLCTGTQQSCIPLPAASSEMAAASANSLESTRSIVIIIGCVVAGLLLVAVVFLIALFLLWRKQKQGRDYWRSGCDPIMDSKAQTMTYLGKEALGLCTRVSCPMEEKLRWSGAGLATNREL